MKVVMNREKASQHDVARMYLISNEKAKAIAKKGLIDYYIYDDSAKKDPVTVRFKKISRVKGAKHGMSIHR